MAAAMAAVSVAETGADSLIVAAAPACGLAATSSPLRSFSRWLACASAAWVGTLAVFCSAAGAGFTLSMTAAAGGAGFAAFAGAVAATSAPLSGVALSRPTHHNTARPTAISTMSAGNRLRRRRTAMTGEPSEGDSPRRRWRSDFFRASRIKDMMTGPAYAKTRAMIAQGMQCTTRRASKRRAGTHSGRAQRAMDARDKRGRTRFMESPAVIRCCGSGAGLFLPARTAQTGFPGR